MKQFKYIAENISSVCNCGNHLIQTGSDVCEICQLPFGGQTDLAPKPSQAELFDADYFEELEAYLESLESAA